jgi:hypothetical protein
MIKSYGNLSDHEFRLFFTKSAISNYVTEKLSTFNEVHDKEYSMIVLENIRHANQKVVFYIDQNILL